MVFKINLKSSQRFLSLTYFSSIEDLSLLIATDGNYMVSTSIQQKIWMDSPFYFGGNFLQGMGGNIWFPLNTLIDPGYVIGTINGSLDSAVAGEKTLCSTKSCGIM